MGLIHIHTFRKYNFGRHPLRCGYRLCGNESGYGILKKSYPKDVAKLLISQVFSNEEAENMEFVYEPRYYRGRNNLQDEVTVYYKKKVW